MQFHHELSQLCALPTIEHLLHWLLKDVSIMDVTSYAIRGRSFAKFCLLLTTHLTLWTFVKDFLYFYKGKICITLTFPVPPTYLPCLVNVVCERPLVHFRPFLVKVVLCGSPKVSATLGHLYLSSEDSWTMTVEKNALLSCSSDKWI